MFLLLCAVISSAYSRSLSDIYVFAVLPSSIILKRFLSVRAESFPKDTIGIVTLHLAKDLNKGHDMRNQISLTVKLRCRLVELSHSFCFIFVQKVFSWLVASWSYGWTTDGRWSILMMFFILFWTLTVLFTMQSMGQSQASRFSSKISSFVFRRQTKLLQVWNDMGVSD